MKFYVFDWEMGENYEFETSAQVNEFLFGMLEDLDEEERMEALESIQIIKGEEIGMDDL